MIDIHKRNKHISYTKPIHRSHNYVMVKCIMGTVVNSKINMESPREEIPKNGNLLPCTKPKTAFFKAFRRQLTLKCPQIFLMSILPHNKLKI